MKKIILSILLCSNIVFAEPPKLVLQIIVDQLRGDLIWKYRSKFGQDGFNFLINHGLNYQSAYHPHANTVTCVGHTTIATGSYPALHGIIANTWVDRDTKQFTYCIQDENSKILPINNLEKPAEGRSPRNIMGSTLSDELVLAKKGKAFGVSFKDRGAITLAGHAGKAFWFNPEYSGFVSSQYYYKAYPQWVIEWNRNFKPKAETWNLSAPKETYLFKDAPTFAQDPTYKEHFPHFTGDPLSKNYYKRFSTTPMADELTANFAMTLLEKEQLGQNVNKTDYLSISFSITDILGHQFGPNSIESEENLLRLDKTLANLFQTIDKKIGLENTLIILTADHGITDALNYLEENGVPSSKVPDTVSLTNIIVDTLAQQFNLPAETLFSLNPPFIYLNEKPILEHKKNLDEVKNTLVEVLRRQPGIFQAYPLPLANTEVNWLSAKVAKMAFPNRAGDIYLVFPPYQMHASTKEKVNHGSPWQYDSYVPLIFANKRFKPQYIFRPVSTTDIAPTLAALLFIKAPSASVGKPLQEVTFKLG